MGCRPVAVVIMRVHKYEIRMCITNTIEKTSNQALRYPRCMFRPLAAMFGSYHVLME